MKTTEGNKLIAEYMGLNDYPHPPETLKYHDDWNWLMPVVEEIEATDEFVVMIEGHGCVIEEVDGWIISESWENKLESTWNAVCDFIEWFNRKK